ncbi:hypothetical protein N0V82_006772 [Gnomoniopsis sp. IMI 355080]|nr:hypothetical protein N0V82_006772 [Gnomoniopsis sp. IMI 355080]
MSAKSMIREPPSGIDLLVVGAGIGGLSAAIECHRKGHNVRVIEKRSDFSTFGVYMSPPVIYAPCIPGARTLSAFTNTEAKGDLIAITRSAQRTMLKWPGFLPRLQANAMPPRLWYFKFDGTELFSLSDIDKGKEGIISLTLWRNQLHEELYKYTSELEIPVTFSRQAVAYEEDDDSGSVLTAEGEKYVADLVIAADGIASKSIDMMILQDTGEVK